MNGIRPATSADLPVSRRGWFVVVGSGVTISVLAAAAVLTHQPFVFPSLGPTAFLLFFAPMTVQACPRNVILCHFLAVVAGVVSLVLFGLLDVPADLEDVTWQRAGAVTLCLCLTLGAMVWLRVPHTPAGATTLIVGLGLLRTPPQLAILMLAVVALTAMAVPINRAVGIRYPLWRPHPQVPDDPTDHG